jgi:hypothetical protein
MAETTPAATADVEIPDRFRALVPGRRYRVTLDDCCVEGHFDAVFVGFDVHDTATGSPFLAGLSFDTAIIGPAWGQFTVEPIP